MLLEKPEVFKTQTSPQQPKQESTLASLPTKISGRLVEPVKPVQFDATEAAKFGDYAKSQTTSGSVGENSLVQTQLGKILSSGSPLLDRARAKSAMASAERGLNNTSMGVQAGEEAVINTALPIAQQDAQTYGNMDMQNARSAADFALSGVNQSFQNFNADKNNAFTRDENNIEREFRSDENNIEREFRSDEALKERDFTAGENQLNSERSLDANKQIETMRNQNNIDVENLRQKHSLALQNDSNAKNIFNNHQAAVLQIMSNPGMSPSQAAAALKILNATTNANIDLTSSLSGIDLSSFKVSGSISGTSSKDKKGNVTNTFNYSDSATPESPVSPRPQNYKVINTPMGKMIKLVTGKRLTMKEAKKRGIIA